MKPCRITYMYVSIAALFHPLSPLPSTLSPPLPSPLHPLPSPLPSPPLSPLPLPPPLRCDAQAGQERVAALEPETSRLADECSRLQRVRPCSLTQLNHMSCTLLHVHRSYHVHVFNKRSKWYKYNILYTNNPLAWYYTCIVFTPSLSCCVRQRREATRSCRP